MMHGDEELLIVLALRVLIILLGTVVLAMGLYGIVSIMVHVPVGMGYKSIFVYGAIFVVMLFALTVIIGAIYDE